MATRLTYRSRLRRELKIDPNARIWNDTTLNDNIQQALYQIQQDGNFDWPFNDGSYSTSTVIGTSTYALPSTFSRIELGTVKYNGGVLTPVDYRWLVSTNSSLAVNGTPTYYYLRGNNIGLFPRPSAVQTLEFLHRAKLEAFADDTTDNGIPDEFTEAVAQYAAYLSWSDMEGRNDKAIENLQNYKQVMEGLFDQFLGARRDESNFRFGFETVGETYNELSNYV